MNVKYINPFIQASKNVINQTTGYSPRIGEVFIKKTPYNNSSVIILIGLTGAIQGSVVMIFNKALALNIASVMMAGIPVKEVDDMVKSAIAELCNMILGNTAMIFSNNDINIDITPPTVLTGDRIEMTHNTSVTISIPLIFSDIGDMQIDISYNEN